MQSLKARSRGISLGIMAADLGDLRHAAEQTAQWGCGILHFDVMDGVFVPGMTAGPGFVKALGAGQMRDVHLMVDQPSRHVESYVQAGADIITVHAEATGAADAIITLRQAAGAAGRPVLAGLALMPGTPLDDIADLLALSPDLILVLSLDPRTNAAPDIAQACARLLRLRQMAPDALLAFDGGVTLDSIHEIALATPDMVVSGSAVFGAADPISAFKTMAQTCYPTSET